MTAAKIIINNDTTGMVHTWGMSYAEGLRH